MILYDQFGRVIPARVRAFGFAPSPPAPAPPAHEPERAAELPAAIGFPLPEPPPESYEL